MEYNNLFKKIKGIFVPEYTKDNDILSNGITSNSVLYLTKDLEEKTYNYKDKRDIKKKLQTNNNNISNSYERLRLIDNKYKISEDLKFNRLSKKLKAEFFKNINSLIIDREYGVPLEILRNSTISKEIFSEEYLKLRSGLEYQFYSKNFYKILSNEAKKGNLDNLENRLKNIKNNFLDTYGMFSIEREEIISELLNNQESNLSALTMKAIMNNKSNLNLTKNTIDEIIKTNENPMDAIEKSLKLTNHLLENKIIPESMIKIEELLNDIKKNYGEEITKKILETSFSYRWKMIIE